MIPPKHQPIRWFTDEILFTYDGGSNIYVPTVPFGGDPTWTAVASSATSMTVENRQALDISGLTQYQETTLDPLSYMVGRWGAPISNATTAGAGILQISWITSTQPVPAYSATTIPYSIGTGPSYDELIGYHHQSWTKDVAIPGIMRMNDSQTIGAMSPSVGKKLYCVASVTITSTNPQAGDTFMFTPSVVTIAQQAVKEPELEYIMRLARTYDHG